jgi:hypothetical protein
LEGGSGQTQPKNDDHLIPALSQSCELVLYVNINVILRKPPLRCWPQISAGRRLFQGTQMLMGAGAWCSQRLPKTSTEVHYVHYVQGCTRFVYTYNGNSIYKYEKYMPTMGSISKCETSIVQVFDNIGTRFTCFSLQGLKNTGKKCLPTPCS